MGSGKGRQPGNIKSLRGTFSTVHNANEERPLCSSKQVPLLLVDAGQNGAGKRKQGCLIVAVSCPAAKKVSPTLVGKELRNAGLTL